MGKIKKTTSAETGTEPAGEAWSRDLSAASQQDFGSNERMKDRIAEHEAQTHQTLRVAILNSKEGLELAQQVRQDAANYAVAQAKHNASWTDEPESMPLAGRFDSYETTINDFNWNGSVRDVKLTIGTGGTLWADKIDKGTIVTDSTWAAQMMLSVDATIDGSASTDWKETGWVDFSLSGNDMTGIYMTRGLKHDFTPDF